MRADVDTSLELVLPTHLYALWGRIEQILAPALITAPELRAEDLYQLALRGEVQIWVGRMKHEIVCAVATEIVNYPRVRRLRVIAVAGKVAPIRRVHFRYMLEWAKAMGCTELEGYANSRAVERLNRMIGLRTRYYFMTMALE